MKSIFALLTGLLAFALPPLHAADATVTEAELATIKARLPFISLGDFLYHRQPRNYSADGKVDAAWKSLMRLHSAKLTVADLQTLSSHDDPDIRALAILGLVAKETPEVVPVCIRLMNDGAPTIPAQSYLLGRRPGDRRIHTRPLTIKDIARRILKMVDCRLKYRRGSVSIEPNADAWWAWRKGNPDWLAWYGFLYKRASQGTIPAPYDVRTNTQGFRKKIDALPPATRSWILLYLSDDVFMGNGRWENHYATEKEMIDAVQDLGAEALIEFLRSGKRRGLRDPSLDGGKKGQRFIVTYASHFFTEEHAEALMELNLFTAAADANPKIVRRAIEAAVRHHYYSSDRARAMVVLASLGDDSDRGSAVKWFFDEPNKEEGSTPQSIFIRGLEYRHPEQWRDIVRRIVAHPEFDQLRPQDVMYLASMVEKLGGEGLLGDGPRYRDDADTTRDELRNLFDLESSARKVLKKPETFLEAPEWKVELGESGHSVALSPDGRLLAIGMAKKGDGVRVLCAENGTERRNLQLEGERVRVAFTDSDQKLICAPSSGSKSVLIWPGEQGEVATHVLPTNAAIFPARTDDRIAIIDRDLLKWLEFPSGTMLWGRRQPDRWSHILAISPDVSLMATGYGGSKRIALIDAANGDYRFFLVGHATAPSKLSFSNDSSLLASIGDDNRVLIWSVSKGKAVKEFRGNGVRSAPIAFAPDDQSFFAASGHGVLAAYAVGDGHPRFGIRHAGNWIQATVPSADGEYLYLMIQHTRGRTGWKSRIECWKLP